MLTLAEARKPLLDALLVGIDCDALVTRGCAACNIHGSLRHTQLGGYQLANRLVRLPVRGRSRYAYLEHVALRAVLETDDLVAARFRRYMNIDVDRCSHISDPMSASSFLRWGGRPDAAQLQALYAQPRPPTMKKNLRTRFGAGSFAGIRYMLVDIAELEIVLDVAIARKVLLHDGGSRLGSCRSDALELGRRVIHSDSC